jgi:hypothetical protein
MPWKVMPDHDGCAFAVVKESDGSTVACHKDAASAAAQVKALYASESFSLRAEAAEQALCAMADILWERKEFFNEEQPRDDNGRFGSGGGGSNEKDSSGGKKEPVFVGSEAEKNRAEQDRAISAAGRGPGASEQAAKASLDNLTKNVIDGNAKMTHDGAGMPMLTSQRVINDQQVRVRLGTETGAKPIFEVGDSTEPLRTPEAAMDRIMDPNGPHNL